jgi:membrane protease YdiL (CAAX protease family)
MAAVSVTGHVPSAGRSKLQRWMNPSSRWMASVFAVVVAVAASQFLSWLWIGQRVGAAAELTRSAVALVGVVVMVATGTRAVRALPVPGGTRPAYRTAERIQTLGGAFAVDMVIVSVVVLVARWVFDPEARGTDGVPLGTAWTTTAGELWRAAVVPAVSEEFVFRFVLLIVLARVLPIRWAVLAQAVVFAVAHTSFGMGFGVISETDKTYLIDGFLSTGLTGLLFGYLTVELGAIWPAIVLHFTGNAIVVLHVVGGTWLSLAVRGTVGVGAVVFILAGWLGLRRSVGLPQRQEYGLSLDRQWRITRRFGPLVCQSPLLRRLLTWADERPFADWPTVRQARWWPRRSARR